MRSDILKRGIETLPHRALLLSAGLKEEDLDLDKPFIGIANSYNNIIPGHIHLNELTREVSRGIRAAGGVPLEWGVPGVCDGIAMFLEMRLSLPSREHIADNIEIMTLSHSLDGWVGITNCDKITPGMLMAAGRLNLPAIILTGGPMKANIMEGQKRHPIEGFRIVGEVKGGKMSAEEAENLLPCMACGAGSCVGLYTANTMAVVTEVLGMSLTKCATTLAADPLKKKQAYESGKKVVELVKREVKPSHILTRNAFENAIRVDMAMGGSTNAVLHLQAIASELDLDIPLNTFNELSNETPFICDVAPSGSGKYHLGHFDEAGGIPSVMKELQSLLATDVMTVTAKPLEDNLETAQPGSRTVIHSLDQPLAKEGGLIFLQGNLAPKGALIKKSAVPAEMFNHRGPARIFPSEADACSALLDDEIKPGEIVVVRYAGPKGAPGMELLQRFLWMLESKGLLDKVVFISDGRFSGTNKGCAIAHVAPEAADAGPIAVVKDGDIIEIDIPNEKLTIDISEEELAKRLAAWEPPPQKVKKGYLSVYSRIAKSADKGAALDYR